MSRWRITSRAWVGALATASLLVAAGAVHAEVSWQHEWRCTTPLVETKPIFIADTFGYPAKVDGSGGGPVTLHSSVGSGAWIVMNDPDAWKPQSPNGTTIEFRMKVDFAAEGAVYAAQFTCTGLNGDRRIELNFDENGVRFFDHEQTHPLEMHDFNTYRLTFTATEAVLYVNDHPEPVLRTGGTGMGMGRSQFSFGDGSSVRIGGDTAWEYVRWTNDGVFPPDS